MVTDLLHTSRLQLCQLLKLSQVLLVHCLQHKPFIHLETQLYLTLHSTLRHHQFVDRWASHSYRRCLAICTCCFRLNLHRLSFWTGASLSSLIPKPTAYLVYLRLYFKLTSRVLNSLVKSFQASTQLSTFSSSMFESKTESLL